MITRSILILTLTASSLCANDLLLQLRKPTGSIVEKTVTVTNDTVIAFDSSGNPILKSYATLKSNLALTNADVGLGNADNTSDANKPVSTAQRSAIDATSSRIIYVATNGSNSTGAINTQQPYLTIAAAHAAAVAANPTASSPVVIRVGAGTFAEAALSMSTPYITIVGAGRDATKITLSSGAITFAAANVGLSSLSLSRSGSSDTGAVLTSTVTSKDNWLDGHTVRNCAISNAAGTAIGMFNGAISDSYVFGGLVIVDTFFGATASGVTFEAPFLNNTTTAQYGIKTAQSMIHTSYGEFDSDARWAQFLNCRFVGRGRNMFLFRALVEANTAGDESKDNWGTYLAVSTHPVAIIGCNLDGPRDPAGAGGSYGTNAHGVSGPIVMQGSQYLGANPLYRVHDGYITGSYIQDNAPAATNSYYVKDMSSFQLTACTGLWGSASQFSNISYSQFMGCFFETDPIPAMRGYFNILQGCYARTGLTNPWSANNDFSVLGYTRRDLALQCWPSRGFAVTGGTETTGGTVTLTDYCPGDNFTAELWIKSTSTQTNQHIIAFHDGTTGWRISFDRANNKIYGRIGAITLGNVTNNATGVWDGNWHHIALVKSGADAWLQIDGVAVNNSTSSAVNLSYTAQLSVGANCNGTSFALSAQDNLGFPGMIKMVRISNVARYTQAGPNTVPKTYIPDANTLGLWTMQTNDPYRWQDQMGKNNLLLWGTPLQSTPVWVPQGKAPME